MSNSITLTDGRLRAFSMENVTICDEYEKNAFGLEIKYLKSLDPDRLLKGFCDIGGVESTAVLYGGWENSNIQGHTMGHYLTALSQAFASTGDGEIKSRIDHIVDVLSLCQAESGYLAAIPEEHYIKLERGETEGTWVPWYTMHKVMSGLIAAYEFAFSQKALKVASRLGDWVYSRTSRWSVQTQKTVLNIEYGGMNDCLYQLYSHTKSEKHLSAAHSFDEKELFDALYQGRDILDGKHANTTIPKILGALNRYYVLGEGEEYYLKVAENFFDIVEKNHTYITGGNSEWEHFGTAEILDAERTECNCETCNTYNMLKLMRKLFLITGDVKYAHKYERTFINAILSSQNPETGMTTYFQPMATGFFKVYSSPYDNFWCCTGSGMESFTKLNDSIYFHSENAVYVNRFTSSELMWKEKGLTLIQKAELPDVTFTIKGEGEAVIKLRVPLWCGQKPVLTLNGEVISCDCDGGYISLERKWCDGDRIEYHLPMTVSAHSLPDNEKAVCLTYGPYVLSADLGKRDMSTSVTGVNVTVPVADSKESGKIKILKGKAEDNLIPVDDGYSFKLINADRELIFSPHYRQHKSRYGIYFIIEE